MSPSLVLSAALGSIVGLLGHAAFGRRANQIPVYWGVGVAGFFAGSILSMLTGGGLVRIGSVPLLESLTTAIVSVLLLTWVLYTRPRGTGARTVGGATIGRRKPPEKASGRNK